MVVDHVIGPQKEVWVIVAKEANFKDVFKSAEGVKEGWI